MILLPQKSFVIFRQLEDPSNQAGLYVQAVVKNAVSRAVIATVQLTDRGSGYFDYAWQTPVDKDGQGTQITIVTSVYSDAAYTTKSDVYGDKGEDHTILDIQRLGGGGGGGIDVDYKRFEKLLAAAIKTIEIPEMKDLDLTSVMNSLKVIQKEIGGIKFPEHKCPEHTCDNGPVLSAIGGVKKDIAEIPPPEPVDLSPVTEAIGRVGQRVDDHKETGDAASTGMFEELKTYIPKALGDVLEGANFIVPIQMRAGKPLIEGDKNNLAHDIHPNELGKRFLK